MKTIIFHPIALPDGELNFKLEVLKNGSGQFYARLFRLETYRVRPSFAQDMQADEAQYVLDWHTLPELANTFMPSAEDCLNSAWQALQKKFG